MQTSIKTQQHKTRKWGIPWEYVHTDLHNKWSDFRPQHYKRN